MNFDSSRSTIAFAIIALLPTSGTYADPIDLNGTAITVDFVTGDSFGLRNGAEITVSAGGDIDPGMQPPASLSPGIGAFDSTVVIDGGSVTGGSNPSFVAEHGVQLLGNSTGTVSSGRVVGGFGNISGGDGVRVNPGAQLDVTGGEVRGGAANAQSFNGGIGVRVITGGLANLTGGDVVGGDANSGPGAAAVLVESTGQVVIDGANLTGGAGSSGGDALRVIVGGSATIRGGEFSAGDFSPGPFGVPGRAISGSRASIDIFGGTFLADVAISNESEVSIFGGEFLSRVLGLPSSPNSGGSIFNIRGGNFLDAIGGTDDTVFNIFGTGLAFDGERFTGFLQDGALFDVAFQPIGLNAIPTFNFFDIGGPSDPPVSVPEPSTIWLFLLALVLAMLARRPIGQPTSQHPNLAHACA